MIASFLFLCFAFLIEIPCGLADSQSSSIGFSEWKHSGSLWLLTTPDGADLPKSARVEEFPILIRLHSDFFNFSEAKSNGEDLRFASSDGQKLAYQIEDWDPTLGIANIWVRVPKIVGDARQEIKVFWGKGNAVSESNGLAVFNESNGYRCVMHMDPSLADEAGNIKSVDTGTTPVQGMIGAARHFPEGKGIFCGDKILHFPTGSSPNSSEAWFRIEKPNGRVMGWGNEQAQGKVVMHHRSPPHVTMDCYFSDANVSGNSRVSTSEWFHVVHTYTKGESRIYVNGLLDEVAKRDGRSLDVKSPARMWIGGWYNNYDFVGDIDEVRISGVTRSEDWIKLQYANQKPNQTLVGPLVRSTDTPSFAVPQESITVAEGKSATVTGKAGGAQKVLWILKGNGNESIVAADRFSYTYQAPRIPTDNKQTLDFGSNPTLTFKAIYPNEVKTKEIAIQVTEAIAEPIFTMETPSKWDGRTPFEIVPAIQNRESLISQGHGKLHLEWTIDGIAVIKKVAGERLILTRAQGSGPMRVSLAIDNGGMKVYRESTVIVTEPAIESEASVPMPISKIEQPVENQFFARVAKPGTQGVGELIYKGTLSESVDSVFLRVFADEKLFATETMKPTAENGYWLEVELKAGLIKYRTEFGTKTGNAEKVLHTATNLVCGDAYLIDGQSNAEATDVGKEDPTYTSDWIRTFGSMAGDPQGARLNRWGNAVVRDRMGGKLQIGYWGMELAKRLVEKEQIPICILNGAVGGSRIDKHQRNDADPTDSSSIYGRLLWRAQQAKLTHGIRAVLWHQGENDQGADGPTGGYGWESYRQYFVDMSAAWKGDYPNIERYYLFQIWPKACSMGVNGSDNHLREVQRTLPRLYSNMSIMSTLGIKPPGGCHFPIDGYAEFARLISPMIEHQIYKRPIDAPISPPDLKRAFFSGAGKDELVLEFDNPVTWDESLVTQFYLDGQAKQVVSGSSDRNRLTLTLKSSSNASKITYLDSASWSPDRLLYGTNGIAALTFCDVPIEKK